MAKLTLWLLNRVVDWADPGAQTDPMRHALSGSGWFNAGHDVSYGDRNRYNATGADAEASPVGALMHEGDVREEYFVPIAVKCLADPDQTLAGIAAADAGDRLQELRNANPYFKPGVDLPWSDFWDLQLPPDGRTRMNTQPGMGLYGILQAEFRRTGRKNVLVGYSQGGLVARYLTFIDQHLVAKEHQCIDGVITVQSPNRGSPLARKQNAASVFGGLLECVAAVADLPPQFFPGTARFLREVMVGGGHFNLERVDGLLDAAMDDLQNALAKNRERAERQLDLFSTARKWLSGLDASPRSAFFDLDSTRLDEAGSVLHSINSYDLLDVYYGAVVGTDCDLTDFVGSMLYRNTLARLVLWFKRSEVREYLAVPQELYQDGVMSEHDVPDRPEVQQYLSDIAIGAGAGGLLRLDQRIERKAHDFVIPSVSQLALPPRVGTSRKFLGNFVNADASHISGADRSDANETDLDLVLKLLAAIGKGLAPA